jgi:hypothetical protein
MGSYNSIYIGVYLEVPNKNKPEVVKYYLDNKGKKTKNKFDPETGQPNPVKEETIITKVIPRPYIVDVPGFVEDEFFSPAYTGIGDKVQTFLLNGKGKFSFYGDDLFNKDLTSINQSQIIEEFKVEYAKYLEYYQKEFGDFTIKYGVVYYAH